MALRDQMGVCIPNYTYLPRSEYDKIAAAFSWVRVDAYWQGQDRNGDVYRLELLHGFVREMAERGVSTLVILNYGNKNYPNIGLNDPFMPPTTSEQLVVWERWVRRLADNLKGYPVAYEVWNEPYSDMWWGGKANAEEYAQLCRFTRDVLRDCAPGATIVSGGGLALFPHNMAVIDASGTGYPSTLADLLSYPQQVDYVNRFIDAGGHLGSDAVAMHPYRDHWVPEDLTEDVWFREHTNLPLWFTELGWNLGWVKTYLGNYPVLGNSTSVENTYWSEDDKARFLARMFLFGAARNIDKQFWYNYSDYAGSDANHSIDPLVDNARYPVKHTGRHQGGRGYFTARREPNFGLVEENSKPYYEDWRVGEVIPTRPGVSYPQATVAFSGGGATTQAVAKARMLDGGVHELVLISGGTGYTSRPTMTITPPGGRGHGAVFVPVMGSGVMTGFEIKSRGFGYPSPKFVSSGGGPTAGSGAVVTLTMSGGKVTAATITNSGQGYERPPYIKVTGGNGSGAQVVCTLKDGGMLDTVAVVKQGSGYTLTPTAVILTGGAGAKFRVTEIVSGGHVTKAEIVDPGSGYLAPPGVYPIGGFGPILDITGAVQNVPGTGTPSPPPDVMITRVADAIDTITLGANKGWRFMPGATALVAAPAAGVQAEAIPIVVGGSVVDFYITNRGSGYVSAPPVTVSQGFYIGTDGVTLQPTNGFGATATAILGTGGDSDKVVEIIVDKGGQGYQPHPEVVLTGGGLNGAEPSIPATVIAVVKQNAIDRPITNIYVIDGGAGYTEDPVVEIRPSETYVDAAFKTTIDRDGRVVSIDVTNPTLNQYYGDYPRLETVGGPGSAKGYLSIYDGKVESAYMLQTGGGFARGATPAISAIHTASGYGAVLRPIMRQRPRPLTPKPPYLAARTLFEELGDYKFIEDLSTTSGVFQQLWRNADGMDAWACWCLETVGTHSLVLPDKAVRIRGITGADINVASPITLTPDPVYIFMER